ncbi:RNA polymerase-binding protein RbpA [Micromonospora halophytica]|uniref:RNA polymerase-binding protein RbpA n=1 Tax=Micromonospora halophytica TaxID=47864 RepID=A0A1C5GSQ8_9ACTN|nr:RNA polymerase-binding protein RbpA [Micromonospora halophytica]SCG36810.1 RNA polymerase-binding protein [Micromonospora halophytica]
MPSVNIIRGARVGSAPERPAERYQLAPRHAVTYWCRNSHATQIRMALDADVPTLWDCPHCGLPAGRDADNPPGRARPEPYKTHLAYVKERRSDAEGEAILAEALAALRRRRGRD